MVRHLPLLFSALVILSAALGGCSLHDDALVWRYVELRGEFSAQHAVGPDEPSAVRVAEAAEANAFLPDMDKPIGAKAQPQPAEPNQPAGPVHWSGRRGPAYDGDFWRSFGRDAKELPATLWDDTKATFTDPWALVGLGLAGVSGIVVNASGSDNRVQDHFERHGHQLNGFWDAVGDVGGNPGLHFAFAGAMYFTSLAREDVKNYEVSKALLNGLTINGLTTLALKGLVRTRSPNGDPHGWPSGHTSSTFTLATIMHEAYGPWVGVPLFAFASFVGYERVDARNHDFSDVISGAVIGIAIGHAVMQNHQPRILGFEVVPWADPVKNAVGIALKRDF